MFLDKNMWLFYVILAGLSWGTYVPIIFYGGNELSAKPGPSGRFMAILCVGIAYFVIGVILPLVMFATNWAGHCGSGGSRICMSSSMTARNAGRESCICSRTSNRASRSRATCRSAKRSRRPSPVSWCRRSATPAGASGCS